MEILTLTYPPVLLRRDLPPSSVAFGNFDGVHVGHQQVIARAVQGAKQKGIRAGVMTFSPHPLEVLGRVEHPSYLTPLEDKLAILQGLGVDIVFVVEFTPEFAKLRAEEFIQQYIIDIHIKHVVTGFDFAFGHRGKGNVEMLQQWSAQQQTFSTDILSSIDLDNLKISSSRIRALLEKGEVELTEQLLGRYYRLRGKVGHGEKRGRTIGFPTANLQLVSPYVVPKLGVYAVYVTIGDKQWQGVCNVGQKPTFYENHSVSIEVHIFEFEGDIYEELITLDFVKYIREEQKFESLDQLIEQITTDADHAKQILAQASRRERA